MLDILNGTINNDADELEEMLQDHVSSLDDIVPRYIVVGAAYEGEQVLHNSLIKYPHT